MIRRRLLSITSIHQLMVGIVCMNKNKNCKVQYYDYLLINNILLSNEAIIDLKKLAKSYNFDKIIDFTEDLVLLNTKKGYKGVMLWYDKIRNILMPLFNHYGLIDTKNSENYLKKVLCSNNIDEIYMRYKFNTPEIIVLNSYPEAKVYIFEDGAGDYINISNKLNPTNININIYKMIKRNYYTTINKRRKLKKYNLNQYMYRRVDEMYELISLKKSDRKKYLIQKVSKDFINIRDEYINIISQLYHSRVINYFNSDYVLFLSTFSSPSDPESDSDLLEIINYTKKTLFNINKKFSNKEIYIKTHPRIPYRLKNYLLKDYPDNILPEELNFFPAEVFFFDPKLIAVVGEMTSSLIYSSQLFNKKSYYIYPADKEYWSNDKYYTVSQTMNTMGVKSMPIN